jgi:hypothetical protein
MVLMSFAIGENPVISRILGHNRRPVVPGVLDPDRSQTKQTDGVLGRRYSPERGQGGDRIPSMAGGGRIQAPRT